MSLTSSACYFQTTLFFFILSLIATASRAYIFARDSTSHSEGRESSCSYDANYPKPKQLIRTKFAFQTIYTWRKSTRIEMRLQEKQAHEKTSTKFLHSRWFTPHYSTYTVHTSLYKLYPSYTNTNTMKFELFTVFASSVALLSSFVSAGEECEGQ